MDVTQHQPITVKGIVAVGAALAYNINHRQPRSYLWVIIERRVMVFWWLFGFGCAVCVEYSSHHSPTYEGIISLSPSVIPDLIEPLPIALATIT